MVMNKKTLCTLFAICMIACTGRLNAQATKYFVKFKYKAQNSYQLSNPSQYLTSGAVWRRTYYGLAFDSTDLPVRAQHISQLSAVNSVTLHYVTKWLNGAVVSVPSASAGAVLANIGALSFVASSTQVNPRLRLSRLGDVDPANGSTQPGLRPSNTGTYNMGGSAQQNQQIQVDCLHEMGYRGQGMVIAVMDVGFNSVNTNPVFDSLKLRGGILGTRDFISGGNSVYEDGAHGAHVLSCMAAVQHGTIMGSAPMANYWLLRTEDIGSETLVEEYNWVRAAEFADSVGVDILTTSLGYTTFDNAAQNHTYTTLNGKTAPMSIAATMAARKGMFVLNAAGNEGGGSWNYISVPADADSICTVGAVDNTGTVGSFSGIGPTADGRIKPDLLARGVSVWIADVNGICFGANGTSFACPILAGGVACVWQRNRAMRNIQLLQILKSTANNAATPNNSKGWGIPNVCTNLVGIEDHILQNAFSVYPNPFSTMVTLRSENTTERIRSVQVLDVFGHTLLATDGEQSGQEIVLSTADLSNGVYFIKINSTSGTVTKKIVKQ